MSDRYTYEPTKIEIFLTKYVGNIFMNRYYNKLINNININQNDKVLDYCCGSGNIANKIAKKLNNGRLVYCDVSEKWLEIASKKNKKLDNTSSILINTFDNKIQAGNFDKIIIHYSLHDFNESYYDKVLTHLINNLKNDGIILIREPINDSHGFKLYEIINLLESKNEIDFDYKISKELIIGEYIDLKCWLNN